MVKWYDLVMVSLSLLGEKKNLQGKYPSYPGKTKSKKVNFLMNFVGAPPKM
jgi:hypothetical protein